MGYEAKQWKIICKVSPDGISSTPNLDLNHPILLTEQLEDMLNQLSTTRTYRKWSPEVNGHEILKQQLPMIMYRENISNRISWPLTEPMARLPKIQFNSIMDTRNLLDISSYRPPNLMDIFTEVNLCVNLICTSYIVSDGQDYRAYRNDQLLNKWSESTRNIMKLLAEALKHQLNPLESENKLILETRNLNTTYIEDNVKQIMATELTRFTEKRFSRCQSTTNNINQFTNNNQAYKLKLTTEIQKICNFPELDLLNSMDIQPTFANSIQWIPKIKNFKLFIL